MSATASREVENLQLIQSLTSGLARLTSSEEVARFVLSQGITHLNATTGSLCLAIDGELEIVASLGYPEDVIRTYRRFPIDKATPAGECAVDHVAIYCESLEQLHARYPIFRGGPLVGDPTTVVTPLLTTRDELLGTLVIGFAHERHFDAKDRELHDALAQQASVALERAQMNEALVEARISAEGARDQLAFLADASDRLGASLDLNAILHEIGSLAVPYVADCCIVYLLDEQKEIRTIVVRNELGEHEAPHPDLLSPSATGEGPVAYVVATGSTFYTSEHDDSSAGSTFLTPLNVRGTRIGAIAFLKGNSRTLSHVDRALCLELGSRAAVAIDNARLYAHQRVVADTLQRALLPAAFPVIENMQFAARYVPGSTGADIGGDWYSVIAGTKSLYFVVGDVSGRGLRAATTMALVRFTMRAYAREDYAPNIILNKTNGELDLDKDGHFATTLAGAINVDRHEITLANAGHLPLLVLENGKAHYVATQSGPPLGVASSAYHPTTITVAPNATLIAYTDGLVERRGEDLDVGLERLRTMVEQKRALEIDDLISSIVTELGCDTSDDDTAILGIRWLN